MHMAVAADVQIVLIGLIRVLGRENMTVTVQHVSNKNFLWIRGHKSCMDNPKTYVFVTLSKNVLMGLYTTNLCSLETVIAAIGGAWITVS